MHASDYAIVVIYLTVVLVLGRRAKGATQTKEAFFLAGRKLGILRQSFFNFGQSTDANTAVGTVSFVYELARKPVGGAEMSQEPISQRAAEHVAAFNRSVRSGDWAAFADRFTPDATMSFVSVPAGPFNGRDAIAAGYASQPPSDTLTVSRAVSSGDVDELWFAWDNGGTGTMTLRWSAHLIAELTVTFT